MFFIVVMIASIAAVGLYSGNSRTPTNPPSDDEPIVEETPSAALTFEGPAPTIDGTKPHVATIKTDKGDIKIELVTDAPETVNSFAFLAGAGFYNGTIFFYVDPKFVAQGGDPTCKLDGDTICSGSGGPGYSLKLEKTQEGHDQWAVVAPTLAQGGEDISGSQFRILYEADPRLDGQETVFGKVVAGQDILQGLSTMAPCTVVSSENCDANLSSALVIEEIVVEPVAVG